jgi:UTP--glucose-1-phosphate uridylyltransferase
MLDAYNESGGNIVAVEPVPQDQVKNYGVVSLAENGDGTLLRIDGMVEKPKPGTEPSNLTILGRYILQPEIFDLLSSQEKGAGGEIQLTDAISALLREEPVLAYRFQGTRFDCGTHIGLIEATIRYALDHEALSDAARETMQRVLGEMGVVDLD